MNTTTVKLAYGVEVTLPALTGTEKQIAWAADLREKTIPDLLALADLVAESGADNGLIRGCKRAIEAALAEQKADRWITYRFVKRDEDWLGGEAIMHMTKEEREAAQAR